MKANLFFGLRTQTKSGPFPVRWKKFMPSRNFLGLPPTKIPKKADLLAPMSKLKDWTYIKNTSKDFSPKEPPTKMGAPSVSKCQRTVIPSGTIWFREKFL